MMFSAHTLHVLHVILRDTLILFIVLFLALFAWLKVGIHIESLTLGKFSVDGLYIKLDKKLTLKADKIVIPETKEKPSLYKVDETFDKIKTILTYFHYIELTEIDFKNNELTLLFADNILYITSDDYEIAGNIERKGNTLVADVSLLYLKKEQVNVVGKLKYFLKKDRLETEGSFEAYNIKGGFAAFKENNDISFAVKSDAFSDLKTLTAKLPVKDILKSWIAHKIVAKEYKLYSLVGKAHLEGKVFKLDLPALRAEALLKEVKIHYKDELAPILVKEAKLSYRDRTLYFDLKEPVYKNRNLGGSKGFISNMEKGKIALLHLDLHVQSQVDEVVHEVLRAYKLKIPVTQKGKAVSADINLIIPLKKKWKSPEQKAKHKIKAHIDIKLAKGDVFINDVKLPVLSGDVQYDKGVVTLKNIDINETWYAVKVNGKVNLKKKKADLKLNVKHVSLGDKKEKLFVLKNKKNVLLKIDYAAHTFDIPDMNVKILRNDKDFTIKLMNLKTIKPYLKNMEIEVDGGHLDIKTKDFKTYSYTGVLKRNSCFFYDKNDVCHTQIPCKGKVSDKTFVLQAFQDRLYIDTYKGLIKVNRLNIDLKAFFSKRDQNKKSGKKGKKLTILGTKSQLRYNQHRLVTDSYKINVSANGNIKAIGKLKGDQVTLTKKGKNIRVEALRIKDQLLHPLIDFKGLHNGRYTLRASGDPEKLLHGEVIIEGGVMKDFKAYNNTLAFINTLPALATLQNPGYSKKGFIIKKGVAKYRKIGQKIIFDTIHIEGTSASIVGKGEIDLKKNTINMNMAIQTARELGKAVGSIPILGYILMGEDKSMTVGLKITGSLSKPKVKTSATKELLKLPLDLIKRTLQSPAHIINKPKAQKKPVEPIKKPELFNLLSP